MASAGTTISIRAQHDPIIFSEIPTTTLFGKGQPDVYTDFGYLVTEIQADGHGGKYKENFELRYDPTGLGDEMGSLYAHFALPALAPRGNAVNAYYVQNCGYVAIESLKLKNGNTPMLEQTGRELYHFYATRSKYAEDPIDPNIFRYESEAQLITQSSSNSMMHVPILFPCTRPDRPDLAFPLTTFYHSSIRLHLRLRSLQQITVNDGDLSLVPNLYGTNTPLTGDAINVRFFATFYLLDDSERVALANANYFRLWYQLITNEYDSPETERMGKLINMTQFVYNCSTRAFFLFFLPNSYVDGSKRSPNGVGLKNYFDYSASHGGESLYEIQVKVNTGETLDPNIPSTLRRDQLWREAYSGKAGYSFVYIVAYQPKLDEDETIHTINPSGVDKLTFHCRKNTNDAGTLFVMQDRVNCVIAEKGVGGVPFQ